MKNYQDKQNVAISIIWTRRYIECSDTHGTSDFPASVMRFYRSLLNINHDKLNILDKVTEYKENIWEPEIENIVNQVRQQTNDIDTIDFERKQIIKDHIHKLFTFIIQTIQDSGVGWTINTSGGRGYNVGPDNIEEFV